LADKEVRITLLNLHAGVLFPPSLNRVPSVLVKFCVDAVVVGLCDHAGVGLQTHHHDVVVGKASEAAACPPGIVAVQEQECFDVFRLPLPHRFDEAATPAFEAKSYPEKPFAERWTEKSSSRSSTTFLCMRWPECITTGLTFAVPSAQVVIRICETVLA
jgi:hypothetical protein